eukprot:TRINITY_DN11507_c0_g1_i1.p1 TRINITY_DN11507_c0_g1~~TRINITY_DN11507_c0_g1_i1.p1  ORF type:complete len:369 (-),score=71.91 TRINITY_DN11507_c0_g1_i1:27-1082(-)
MAEQTALYDGSLPRYDVERDAGGFVASFSLEEPEEIKQFFQKFGFVVIKDVLTKEECNQTIDDIWNFLHNKAQVKRENPKTWENGNWSRSGLWNEGILGYDPIITRQALKNRQNARLHQACAILYGTEDLLVNQDRYGLFRNTNDSADETEVDRPEWQTMENLHFDMNPWVYIEEQNADHDRKVLKDLKYRSTQDYITENNYVGCLREPQLHIQGLINLADNNERDGGFQLVPGFHHHLEEWARATNNLKAHYGRKRFIVLPEDCLRENVIHVSSRAGSVILWNQTVAHGSRPNKSDRIRYAQFFKMFPAQPMEETRCTRRAQLSAKKIAEANFESDLTSLGEKLFGLKSW